MARLWGLSLLKAHPPPPTQGTHIPQAGGRRGWENRRQSSTASCQRMALLPFYLVFLRSETSASRILSGGDFRSRWSPRVSLLSPEREPIHFPRPEPLALYMSAFLAFTTAAASFSAPAGKYTNMCLWCLSFLAWGSTVGSRVSPWKSYGPNTHQSAELIENRSVWNKRK